MGKNTEKYRYLDVGLKKDGWTLAQLAADAEFHEMPDQLAKYAASRLTDYYLLVKLGIITPQALAAAQGLNAEERENVVTVEEQEERTVVDAPRSARRTTRRSASEPAATEENEDRLEESNTTGANAGAALSYFLEDEDD